MVTCDGGRRILNFRDEVSRPARPDSPPLQEGRAKAEAVGRFIRQVSCLGSVVEGWASAGGKSSARQRAAGAVVSRRKPKVAMAGINNQGSGVSSPKRKRPQVLLRCGRL